MDKQFTWAGEIYDDGSRDDRWVCGDLFISKREFFNGFPREHYQVYRAVGKRPVGRRPWTVDNRRINTAPIFDLEVAIRAGLEFAQNSAAA